jgi:hypothetical protein
MEPTPEIKELNKAFGSEIEELREELLQVDNKRRSGNIGPETTRVIVIIADPNELTKESIPLDKAGDWYNRFQNWQADLVADGRKTISKIVAVSDGYYTKFGDREISFYFSQFNEVNE